MPRFITAGGTQNEKINESSADVAALSTEEAAITSIAFAAGGTGADAGGYTTEAIRLTYVTARDDTAASQLLLVADLAAMGFDLDQVRQRANRLMRCMTANGLLPANLATDRPLPTGATVGVAVTEVADATLTVPATTYSVEAISTAAGEEAGAWDTEAERDTSLTELDDGNDDMDALEVEFVVARADIEILRVELNHLLQKAIDVGLYPGALSGAGELINT